MNVVSLVSTTVARVMMTGILSAVLFNKTVVRHTRHALKEAEQASPKFAVITLCISTLALFCASDRIACEILGLAETCSPTTSGGCSLATAHDDPRSPAFSHDESDDFKTPLSSPSISSPGNSLDSIATLTSSSTVSKLGDVFGGTPRPPAVSNSDSDDDVVLRKWTTETVPEFGTPVARAPENILNSIIKRMRHLSLSDSRSFPSTPTRA